MKKSQYVSVIRISERYTLLYNSLTNIFVILTPELNHIWESFPSCDLNQNKNFESVLIEGGFIISSEVDESRIFINNLIQNINDGKHYHLIINPTLDCNLGCWYCYETHSHDRMDEKMIMRVRLLITKILNRSELEHFHLSFFGGEPFLYFNLIVKDLIKYAYTNCLDMDKSFSLSFTTNGSLINDPMIDELKRYDDATINFQITIDGNKDFHNKVRHFRNGIGTYEIIIKNIKKLLLHGFSVVMRINFTKENIEYISEVLNDLCEPIFINNKLFHVDFQQVWQDRSSYRTLTDSIDICIDKFRTAGVNVIYHYINRMNDPCYADKTNELIINYNGEVYKCTAQDFDRTMSYGSLKEDGTIDWNNKMMNQRKEHLLPPSKCISCRIAPICGGGCAQHLINNEGKLDCVLNNDEKLKDKFILDKFENQYVGNKNYGV